jgi:1-deoxy-D-xylulose-5-phosphate reductoisomerase
METAAFGRIGHTGSIGTQALDVAARHADRFSVVALTAHRSAEALFKQVARFRPALAGLTGEGFSLEMSDRDALLPRAFCAPTRSPPPRPPRRRTAVLVSVVGMCGLNTCFGARPCGSACCWPTRRRSSRRQAGDGRGAQGGRAFLLPVDSEHSAVFPVPAGRGRQPDRQRFTSPARAALPHLGQGGVARAATREAALRHPTWTMGQKITVDSATLFNKALEMIEARWLFDIDPSRIQVLIHPQSVVHSAVGFADGGVIAQLGTPDMRLPILYAMAYPDRLPTGGAKLDFFAQGALTFERPDPERFPSLRLAAECLSAGAWDGLLRAQRRNEGSPSGAPSYSFERPEAASP